MLVSTTQRRTKAARATYQQNRHLKKRRKAATGKAAFDVHLVWGAFASHPSRQCTSRRLYKDRLRPRIVWANSSMLHEAPHFAVRYQTHNRGRSGESGRGATERS